MNFRYWLKVTLAQILHMRPFAACHFVSGTVNEQCSEESYCLSRIISQIVIIE